MSEGNGHTRVVTIDQELQATRSAWDRAQGRLEEMEQVLTLKDRQIELLEQQIPRRNGHRAQSAQSAQSEPCTTEELEIVQSGSIPWKPFPVDLLPRQARDFVVAQSAALNCDQSMIGPATLVVLAAGIGNSFRVKIKNAWKEPSTLWLAVISPSGTMKSPAVSAATEPVSSLELDLKDEHEGRLYLYEQELVQFNALPKAEKKSQDEPVEPARKRLRVSDSTIESIALNHMQNARGLLLARDELAGWIGSFDRYARGESDLQAWIEMYDGRYVQIDRKTTNPPVLDLPHPAVCVVGTVQPKIYADKLKEAHFVSGFLPRQLLVHPPERPRQWTDAEVSDEVRESYHGLVRSLYRLPFDGKPGTISLSRGAKRIYTDFYNENASIMEDLTDGVLRSVLSKVEAIAARLSLILHLSDHPSAEPEEITEDAMTRAVGLATWFRQESARIYDVFGFEEKSLSRDERLAEELPEEFTWEDVAGLWEVQRRASFKTIKRLIEKGLAEDAGHGKYSRCTMHYGHSVHFGHFGDGEAKAP